MAVESKSSDFPDPYDQHSRFRDTMSNNAVARNMSEEMEILEALRTAKDKKEAKRLRKKLQSIRKNLRTMGRKPH